MVDSTHLYNITHVAGFWAWDFHILDENNNLIAEVNRNFVGFAREVWDTTLFPLPISSNPSSYP